MNIYGRQSNSGTYTFVKQRLGCEFTPYAKQMNGNAQILEAIKADKSGIGYVGAGYIKHGHRDLKVLVVRGEDGEGVSPLDAQAVARGRYSFQRPLYQYFRSESYERVKPFIDFENTPAGQAIIARAGYYAAMP